VAFLFLLVGHLAKEKLVFAGEAEKIGSHSKRSRRGACSPGARAGILPKGQNPKRPPRETPPERVAFLFLLVGHLAKEKLVFAGEAEKIGSHSKRSHRGACSPGAG